MTTLLLAMGALAVTISLLVYLLFESSGWVKWAIGWAFKAAVLFVFVQWCIIVSPLVQLVVPFLPRITINLPVFENAGQ